MGAFLRLTHDLGRPGIAARPSLHAGGEPPPVSGLFTEASSCLTLIRFPTTGMIPVPVPGDPEPTVYGPYYGSDEPGAPTDPAVRLIKTPHKSRYSPLFTSGHLCGACHDVFTPDETCP
jgi:hypothetical protein